MLRFFVKYIIMSLILLFAILLAISFFTLLERKVLGGIQRRQGPIYTGFFGILQPFADGLKLFLKEVSIPAGGYYYVFLLASILSLTLSLLSWSVIPFSSKFVIADLNFGMLFLLFISSLNVYSTLFSGWASNSKYGLLGSIRAGAQMISYELPMTLCLLPIALYTSSFNLTNIVIFQEEHFWFILFIPAAYVFFVAALAETNRTPFDLPEAESELVSGYNIEYSSLPFAFFFLAEYNHMLVMSFLFSILFLGGWSNFTNLFITPEEFSAFYHTFLWDWLENPAVHSVIPKSTTHAFLKAILFGTNETIQTSILTIKAIVVALLFISVRAVAPRYKYIQLINLCWSVFIPFLFFYVTLVMYAYTGAVAPTMMNDHEFSCREYDKATAEFFNRATAEEAVNYRIKTNMDFYCDLETGKCTDYFWVKDVLFETVLKEERFVKFLLVKYEFVLDYENPYEGLIETLSRDTDFARKVFLEYYLQGEYQYIFSSVDKWYDERVTSMACYPHEKQVRPDKVFTTEVLLERYFYLGLGDLELNKDTVYQKVDRYKEIPIWKPTVNTEVVIPTKISNNSANGSDGFAFFNPYLDFDHVPAAIREEVLALEKRIDCDKDQLMQCTAKDPKGLKLESARVNKCGLKPYWIKYFSL